MPAGGTSSGSRHADTSTVAREPVKLSTAKVQQLDLVTYDETTATLGFTTSATVSSPVAGTVTSIVAGGDTVDAGTVVATVDGAPVVAMIGDVPGYRDLSTSSSDGADIRQLELNLVQLGFDPDHKIVIDEKFDSATKAAVTAWEDSLGLDGDGKITTGELVFVPGRLLVDTVSATVGGSVQAGTALVVGRQAERKYLVVGSQRGRPLIGSRPPGEVTTGTVLYWSNDLPVIAIEGDAAATPVLSRSLSDGVSDGVDVKLFETGTEPHGFHCRLDDDGRRSLRLGDGDGHRGVVGIARRHRRRGEPRRARRVVRRRARRAVGRHSAGGRRDGARWRHAS